MIKERYSVKKNPGLILSWYIIDNEEECVIINDLIYKYKADELCKTLNELHKKEQDKQRHIVVLEGKIHRMREAIHKLDWLATHRNAELIRENYALKRKIEKLERGDKYGEV